MGFMPLYALSIPTRPLELNTAQHKANVAMKSSFASDSVVTWVIALTVIERRLCVVNAFSPKYAPG